MATLTLTDKKAREIYPKADNEMKAILEESFGKQFFNQKITDRIKTFEDACEILGIDWEGPNSEDETQDEIAYRQLKIIVRALNEGWKPDWNNSSQYKWYPWFHLNKPGFQFDGAGCDCSHTNASGGSRLCFASEELARYAGKQFEDIYKALLD